MSHFQSVWHWVYRLVIGNAYHFCGLRNHAERWIGFKSVVGSCKNLGPCAGSYFVTASEAAFIPHDCEAALWMFCGADRCTGNEHRAGDSCLVMSWWFLIHPCTTCVAGPLVLVGNHGAVRHCCRKQSITPMPQLRPFMEKLWQQQKSKHISVAKAANSSCTCEELSLRAFLVLLGVVPGQALKVPELGDTFVISRLPLLTLTCVFVRHKLL